jgi:hypothetical protein
MRKKATKLATLFAEPPRELSAPWATAPVSASMPVLLGTLVASGTTLDAATLMVEFTGAPNGAVAARLAIEITEERLLAAVTERQPVVLVFENGNPRLPIVIGLIEKQPLSKPTSAPAIEADVDGRRVRVVGQDEIVLQCGKASVTLRRNGRVLIRGTYVETQSEGTNRIKGGQVQIN